MNENPPRRLLGAEVLEFVIFDQSVEKNETALLHFDAGPGDPLPVKGLAICRRSDDEHPEVLYLYYCADGWEVDRQQMWNWPGGGPRADSIEVLKNHADTRFTNLEDKWVVASLIESSEN